MLDVKVFSNGFSVRMMKSKNWPASCTPSSSSVTAHDMCQIRGGEREANTPGFNTQLFFPPQAHKTTNPLTDRLLGRKACSNTSPETWRKIISLVTYEASWVNIIGNHKCFTPTGWLDVRNGEERELNRGKAVFVNSWIICKWMAFSRNLHPFFLRVIFEWHSG